MALFETWLKSDLKKPLKIEQLKGNLFSSDNGGNQIGVEVLDNGSPATLTGGVMGYVIRADGATVAVNGSLSGNRASIVLPASAYVVTGQVSIAIKVGTTTVGACTAYVYRTTTDSLVDPGTIIPSVQTLISQIETAVASIPADYSSLWSSLAPAFSTSEAYTAGQYTTYNGGLYRFVINHAAGSWSSSDVSAVVIGNDLCNASKMIGDMGAVSVDGYPLTIGHMMDTGKWGQLSAGSYKHFVFPVSSGDVVDFKCTVKNTVVAFVTNYTLPLTSSTNVLYSSATGFTSKISITKETLYTWTTPSDAKYLIVEKVFGSDDVGISVFTVNGYDCTTKLDRAIVDIEKNADALLLDNVADSDALRFMHDGNGITWEEGTLDSDGVKQTSDRSYVSSYIDLHNRNLYICVPADGSVTTRLYFYSEQSESSFGVRGTASAVSRVTTNGQYRYCRILLYYTSSSVARDTNLTARASFLFGHADNYRGKIGQLGVTAFSQCTNEGYYSFIADDLTNISDKPAELTSGGTLFVYSHFGSFTLYQVIYDTNGNKYVRYGSNTFVRVSGENPANYIITPTYEIGAITSGTGANASSTKRVRMVSSASIDGGIILTIPSGMKAEYIPYMSDGSTRGETNTGFLTEGTHYIYPRYGETYFRIYGGYTDDSTITDAVVGNLFALAHINNYDSPVWLALGDSITQGYYSYNDGTSDAIARTLNCWAAVAARKANLRLVNSGVGGSGYVHNGTVLDQKNAKAHVDDLDFSGVDFVTLSWGVNDWKYEENIGSMSSTSGDGTIYGNMKYVVEKIISENPLCKIFVVTPLNSANTTKNYGTEETNWGLGYATENCGTLEDVYQAEKSIAEYYGIQLIDQTHSSIVNRKNLLTALTDGVHPSLLCHNVIGSEMAGKITFR